MKSRSIILIAWSFATLLSLAFLGTAATHLALEWDASPSTNVTEYAVYWSVGTNHVAVGGTNAVRVPAIQLSVTFSNVSANRYNFRATARLADGTESDATPQVSWTNLNFGPTGLTITVIIQSSAYPTGSPWTNYALSPVMQVPLSGQAFYRTGVWLSDPSR
jgi:hypothetical protein